MAIHRVHNKATRIPPLNTFRFVPANDLLPAGINSWPFDRALFHQHRAAFQSPHWYTQKVSNSDMITIYMDSLALRWSVYVIDRDNNIISTLVEDGACTFAQAGNNDSKFNNQYNTFISRFTFGDIHLPDGIYYTKVVFTYIPGDGGFDELLPDANTNFISEPFHLRTKPWANTNLLEYVNSVNNFDVLFENAQGPTSFQFRVEGFVDIDPAGHLTAFEDMQYKVVPLQDEPYRVATFSIGSGKGLPPWMLDKINRALCCDTFTIDGVLWKKDMNAALSVKKTDDFAFKTAAIQLRDPSDGGWEYSNGADREVFRIHDDTHDDTHD